MCWLKAVLARTYVVKIARLSPQRTMQLSPLLAHLPGHEPNGGRLRTGCSVLARLRTVKLSAHSLGYLQRRVCDEKCSHSVQNIALVI